MSDWQLSLLMHWYDRNPESKVDSYGGTKVPHLATERVVYTCLAGKVAMVEVLQAHAIRVTAAGTVNIVNTYWMLTPKGGTAELILFAQFLDNNVGAKNSNVIAGNFMIFEGDKLQGFTYDASITGTCSYSLAYKITEFDFEPPKSYLYKKDPTPEVDIQQPLTVNDPPM